MHVIVLYGYRIDLMSDLGSEDGKDFDFSLFIADTTAILWTLFDLEGLCEPVSYVIHCF